MRKSITVIFALLIVASCVYGQNNETLQLPEPERKGGMPLMEALNKRCTNRNFVEGEISLQQLSNLLWAASGINRSEEKKRTSPTARNSQQIDIYVAINSGLFLYDFLNNCLIKVLSEDVREYMGRQDFTKIAAVMLIYVSNHDKLGSLSKENKDFYSATDTGFIAQNVGLFCASEGLANVVLGAIDRDLMREKMKLTENQHIVLSHAIGVLN